MSFIRRFSQTDKKEVVKIFDDLAKKASKHWMPKVFLKAKGLHLTKSI